MKKEKKIDFPTIDLDDAHRCTIDYTTSSYLENLKDYGFTVEEHTDNHVVYTYTDTPVETVEYRGYTVPIFMDDPGQQYYCILDGEEVGFGAYNFNYVSDIEYLIDEKLDTIAHLKPGAKLSWFQNGGHRDIKLEYRTRLIKVWLVADADLVDVKKLTEESENILAKLITADETK